MNRMFFIQTKKQCPKCKNASLMYDEKDPEYFMCCWTSGCDFEGYIKNPVQLKLFE